MTDIDKLRELNSYWAPFVDEMRTGNPKLYPILAALPSLLAELVGLRTEVDQLRGENVNLRESAETATFAANRLGEIANVTEERREGDRLHYDAEANTLRAEHDALQARIDAATVENERLVAVLNSMPKVTRERSYTARSGRVFTRPVLHGVFYEMTNTELAALGVDPQKETQQ